MPRETAMLALFAMLQDGRLEGPVSSCSLLASPLAAPVACRRTHLWFRFKACRPVSLQVRGCGYGEAMRSRFGCAEAEANRDKAESARATRDPGRGLCGLCGLGSLENLFQVKGSGQDEDFEDLAKERGGNPLGGRGLEPEEDHLDYQSRWKRWAADIEFRLAVFESPERGRVKRERERAKGGVGEVLELELEDFTEPLEPS